MSSNTPAPITDAELARVSSCKTSNEWRDTCDALKNARGGQYPSDWWAKVKLTGLMDRVLGSFGQSSEIRILPLRFGDL